MDGLLKFITCGSVDDGKSTLIGHMLYSAKLIFADQKQSLILDSKVGARNGELDYSLLLDGLAAEREQGITIDVAYRFFSTEKRSFIVADTPGHEEYTRNMAVGASFADLAIILVDASKGVLTQTKRHTYICSMMGIRHFVFAVNKMDLIDFDENKFKNLNKMIRVLMAEFEYDSLAVIPVSATDGDNITKASQHTLWYSGEPLLSYLEHVDVREKDAEKGFAMPVQRVCRPDQSFRGFEGQIESGQVAVGDEIVVLPSGETAHVKRILDAAKEVECSGKGHAVTLALDKEIDISRGSVLVKGRQLSVCRFFTARLLWMDDERLVAGKDYLLELGTKKVPAMVMNIKHKVNVNDGSEMLAGELYKNELAVCDLSTTEKVVLDRFEESRGLGAFILIDRVTHMTCACGVVLHPLRRSDNLTWHDMDITKKSAWKVMCLSLCFRPEKRKENSCRASMPGQTAISRNPFF